MRIKEKRYIEYDKYNTIIDRYNQAIRKGFKPIIKKNWFKFGLGCACLTIAIIPNGLGFIFYPLSFYLLGLSLMDLEKIKRKFFLNFISFFNRKKEQIKRGFEALFSPYISNQLRAEQMSRAEQTSPSKSRAKSIIFPICSHFKVTTDLNRQHKNNYLFFYHPIVKQTKHKVYKEGLVNRIEV